MNRRTAPTAVLAIALGITGLRPVAHGQYLGGNTLTFVNRSGDDALVKLVGPSRETVLVPDGASRTVDVEAGSYYILVRYGAPGRYRYTRGNRFEIMPPPGQYAEASMMLHKVVGGNYGSRSSTQGEFEGIR